MPRPSKWKLDFSRSQTDARKSLGPRLQILGPMVEIGHEFMYRARRAAQSDVETMVLVAFRQCLESADAVDVLMRHQMVIPAMAMARATIDNTAQMTYLHEKDDPFLAAVYHLDSIRFLGNNLRARLRHAEDADDAESEEILQHAVRMHDEFLDSQTPTGPWKWAREELAKLRRGQPWYAVSGGPRNVHPLLDELGLKQLSIYYSECNDAVHGSSRSAHASEDPTGEGEWLLPLRSESPWSTQVIRVTGLALIVALLGFVQRFHHRDPALVALAKQFWKRHGHRCDVAGLQELKMKL